MRPDSAASVETSRGAAGVKWPRLPRRFRRWATARSHSRPAAPVPHATVMARPESVAEPGGRVEARRFATGCRRAFGFGHSYVSLVDESGPVFMRKTTP